MSHTRRSPDMPYTYIMYIEYDGTPFSGWQKQPGCRTVQQEIETAVKRILGYPVKVTAAGRTDKGVHALGQVASFTLQEGGGQLNKLRASFNGVLPPEITITRIKKVSEEFNARYCARQKIYEYRIWNKPYRATWYSRHTWGILRKLNLETMRTAARDLIGRHDFSAFDASGSMQPNKTVDMQEIVITARKGVVFIAFRADRFLYKMVRNITGILVATGLGKVQPQEPGVLLRSKKRPVPGHTAPPLGLFLKEIVF